MGAYKYMEEIGKKKQTDACRFLSRMRAWEFRHLPALHRVQKPTRTDKARRLGYKAKQGVMIFRVRVKRGGRKRKVEKGICYGKPATSGVHKYKPTRNQKSIAEERAGKKLGNLRLLNSYWVSQDAVYKWYEMVMVDPMHKAVRNDPRINFLCSPKHKHRELRGITSAGRRARGLGHNSTKTTKKRPSMRQAWKKHQTMNLRRYR